jgi:hypothetical protein
MAIGMRRGRRELLRSGERPELFDTTEPDSVSFSKSPVDGSGLGHTHLGAADEGGSIPRRSVAVSDEAARAESLLDGSPEDPTIGSGIGKTVENVYSNAGTATAPCYPQ